GRPNTAAGVQGPVKATSVLTLSPPRPMSAGGASAPGPCRIEVEPAQLTLVDRGDPVGLTVRVTGRPAGGVPKLVLAALFAHAPELGAALAAVLGAGLKRAADPGGGWEAWHAELALQLEPEARRALWERSLGGSLEVTVRAEVPGKASCE